MNKVKSVNTNAELMLTQLDKLHATKLGAERIKRNLALTSEEPVAYCRAVIEAESCICLRRGKNWYFENNGIIVTVNALSYTIITVHQLKNRE